MIIRSSYDAIQEVKERGMPSEIAFDHDLGWACNDDGEYFDTSMKFIHWMINAHLDEGLVIPADFKFSVHSQNPIGAKNIKEMMNNFLNHIGAQNV